MYYKQYGDTEMKVSAVGMGCMRFNEEDVRAGRLDRCAEIVLYALEQGINYFDTAPFYCEDKSEEITGMALSQVKRDQYYVSSKANFNTTSAMGGKVTADAFWRRLELTLQRLRVDYLDFYHLWCMLDPGMLEEQWDVLGPCFEEAKAKGIIRNIVFSSHMMGNDLEKVIGGDLFKGMLIGYNALNYRFRQSGIKAAHDRGMGVVVMNPLGGGLIPNHPDKFAYLAEGTDLTVPQAALRFVASQREITIALNGFTTKEHVDSACKAVEGLQERPAEEICAELDGRGIALNDLCTGCGYCKGCPVDIPIVKFMDTYNQKLLGNSMRGHLDGFWHLSETQAAECIACGKCERACTQHLPIIERLQEIAAI